MNNLARPGSQGGAIADQTQPAYANHFAVAGRFICVEALDPEAADIFGPFYSGWPFARLGAFEVEKPDAKITVRPGPPTPPPAGLDSFETAGGGLCRTDGRTYVFERDGSV